MIDDLFSDDPSLDDEVSSSEFDAKVLGDNHKTRNDLGRQQNLNHRTSSADKTVEREERVNKALFRCMDVMDVAHQQMRLFENLQIEVFGSIDEADDFNDSVERRINADPDFKAQYQMMKEGHRMVIDRLGDAPHLKPPQKPEQRGQSWKPGSSYVPGDPVSAPPKSETSRKNHLLRKKMV